MSASGVPNSFDPRVETYIPTWQGPGPVPTGPERVYVLSMQVENGRLGFFFVDRPASPDPSGDDPLQIRVPYDCVIVLRLDASWDWQFPTQNAITLGPMAYKDDPRYFNLTPTMTNGRCQEVRFNAKYLDTNGVANLDPYAIYVELGQAGSGSMVAVPLLLRIDPDVANPGDHK